MIALGALEDLVDRLGSAKINMIAVTGLAAGQGRYGAILLGEARGCEKSSQSLRHRTELASPYVNAYAQRLARLLDRDITEALRLSLEGPQKVLLIPCLREAGMDHTGVADHLQESSGTLDIGRRDYHSLLSDYLTANSIFVAAIGFLLARQPFTMIFALLVVVLCLFGVLITVQMADCVSRFSARTALWEWQLRGMENAREIGHSRNSLSTFIVIAIGTSLSR